MKKIFLLLLSLLLVVGCSNNEEKDPIIDDDSNIEEQELKEPIVDWCQVYNPNGFNTVTCLLTNPNKVDIEVTYDLVYYKDGKEIARSENYSNFNVSPKHKDVIWGNVGIPDPSKVEEVKMENIQVFESYNKSIDAEIKHTDTKDGYEYFSIKHEKDPEVSTVSFFLYNDVNKNKKCDKGELVVVSTSSTFEKEDTVYFEIEGYDYTNYEIFYNAY